MTPAERAAHAADQLVGTAKDLREVASDADRDDMAFCNALDVLALQCELCGWWHDAEEINTDTPSGEALCDDCLSTT